MKSYALLAALTVSLNTNGLEVAEPQLEALPEITISSPDDTIATLGKVEYIIDWKSRSDSLLDLRLKRQDVLLPGGEKASNFAYDLDANVLVAAREPVSRIVIDTVSKDEVLVVFYDSQNRVIAPNSSIVGVFDLNLSPIPFTYNPKDKSVFVEYEVTTLIDTSGSMTGFMDSVFRAADDFSSALPLTTYCQIVLFGDDVKNLNETITTCKTLKPYTIYKTNGIKPSGGTALFSAFEKSLFKNRSSRKSMPHLIVVITDGVNTERSMFAKDELISMKGKLRTKLLVFWIGNHDPEHLAGLVDFQVTASGDIEKSLHAFYRSVGISLKGMQRLSLVKP